MGYCYGYNDHGQQVLACDGCGDVGGVRKRPCRFKVSSDTLRSPGRIEMRYCYPPALCGGCFTARGGARGIHGDQCRDGAARAQAGYDATEAGLDAGESYVIAAWGAWQPGVPEGMTGVVFKSRVGEVAYLVPAGDYDPAGKPKLSDYPGALPWAGTGMNTKQVSVS